MTVIWTKPLLTVHAERSSPAQARVLIRLWEAGEISLLEFQTHLAAIATGHYGEPKLGDVVTTYTEGGGVWRVVGLDDNISLSGPIPCRGMQHVSFDEFAAAWKTIKS